MLQYSLLHLFGYKVSMDDLKAFRVRYPAILAILDRLLTEYHVIAH